LAWRKLVDGSHRLRGGFLGAGHVEARERQRERQRATGGPDRRVYVRIDGTVPWNEDWGKKKDRWPENATGLEFKPFVKD
jgi:hypothetical protein